MSADVFNNNLIDLNSSEKDKVTVFWTTLNFLARYLIFAFAKILA
jgi:hypothetical protein